MTLTEAIDAYLANLAGKPRNTIKTYRVALNKFARLVGETLDASALTVEHVNQFAQALAAYAPATITNYLAALSAFYEHALIQRWMDFDASETLRLKKTLKQHRPKFQRLPRIGDPAAFDALIILVEQAALPSHAKPADVERFNLRRLRDLAILRALRVSGLRVGELVSLKRDDLNYHTKSAHVSGKGKKERIVYFNSVAWQAMQAYLKARGDGERGRALGELPVFARHDRGAGKRIVPLTTQTIQHDFATWCERGEITPPITPHKLRHMFAQDLLDATGDLSITQDALGHSSPVTTRIYAKTSPAKIRAAHKKTFEEQTQ